ncbi:cupin domain-containing protein [Granulosicoccus sp. 3-233]|uniref:cupin domain-containing protein n=1 Tax=Granulosicoccus sp. 3-233 TaxID=3417969 RepID=UPI003D35929D
MGEPEKNALSLVLSPLTLPDFMSQYWERETLHIERDANAHFNDILQMSDIESLLSSRELLFPAVQLSCKRSPVAVTAYTDEGNRIVPRRLIEEYRRGATIVMSAAHQSLPALAGFRRAVQAELGLRCQTNLYLSPPGEQGFGAHYDSHDVFILQVHGSKTFNFHEGGIEMPYAHEGFDAAIHEPGELADSVILHAGDTLYIPRGVFHDAVAGDQASLHITLGIHAMTLRDALLEMVDVMAQADPRYRRSVPTELWRAWSENGLADDASAGSVEALRDLLNVSLEEHHWQAARTRLLDAVSLDNAQDCLGQLTHPPGPWLPGTVICLRADARIVTERQAERVSCRVPGQVMELSDPLAQAFEQLLSRQVQALSDWTALTEDQRQALCEQLWQANIIEVVDEPTASAGAFDEPQDLQ